MTPSSAAKIVQALANGVDPTTGEILAGESPFNDVTVVRALHVALQALSKTSDFDACLDAAPERNGKPWTEQEDVDLRRAFQSGVAPAELVASHRRSAGGVASRLVKLGLIDERSKFRLG